MASNSYTAFNALVDIIASPAKAYDEVKQHTSWLWWPLLIGMLSAIAIFSYYYSWVDFPWLVEETIRQMKPEDRAEGGEAIRKFMEPGKTMMFTLIMIVVMSMLIYTLQAVYYHLANKLTSGSEIGFGQWFSFSVWTGFVGVFGSLSALIVILMAESNQISSQELQLLSVNSLVLHVPAGDPWFTWASSLSLLHFWMIFLAALGFSRWTGASMVKSAVIAALPFVAIFGIWAFTV